MGQSSAGEITVSQNDRIALDRQGVASGCIRRVSKQKVIYCCGLKTSRKGNSWIPSPRALIPGDCLRAAIEVFLVYVTDIIGRQGNLGRLRIVLDELPKFEQCPTLGFKV